MKTKYLTTITSFFALGEALSIEEQVEDFSLTIEEAFGTLQLAVRDAEADGYAFRAQKIEDVKWAHKQGFIYQAQSDWVADRAGIESIMITLLPVYGNEG
jgi:hypothetical protein